MLRTPRLPPMLLRLRVPSIEVHKRRSLARRILILHGVFLTGLLIIIARLIELQILEGTEYRRVAQAQHYGGVVLPARRGEIWGVNSKTGEQAILATNTTLDLLYIDPLVVDNPAHVADTMSAVLFTEEFYEQCSRSSSSCPRELIPFFEGLFDPLTFVRSLQSGSLLEPLPSTIPSLHPRNIVVPDLAEARRLFARDMERRIAEKRVRFVPLKYSATKVEMEAVRTLGFPGVDVQWGKYLVYADPERVPQSQVSTIARSLSSALRSDASLLEQALRSRPLRYVPVMRRLPPALSLKVKELLLRSWKDTLAQKSRARDTAEAERILDPFRCIALLPEHWRFYPDATIASHVVGFLNANQEPQYGIERTFNPQLRGQEGVIRTVSDPTGRQILTSEQTIIDPHDGEIIVLTIDPTIQRAVETILADGVRRFQANSAQVVVLDPFTGRILAMANAPLFDRNVYGGVYEKEAVVLSREREKGIVVELYHPLTNTRVVKAYLPDVTTVEGRKRLSAKTRSALEEIERVYDLADIARYYLYYGENDRTEIFPTDVKGVWLKYRNTIGVGAYLNRVVQETYEPGSIMKPITMAIALDQGEVVPTEIYDDTGPVQADEYTIKNALLVYYGKVTMTNCLELSINTCMTSVSAKLGPKLLYSMLLRFGFGRVTGIELDDELPGSIRPWRSWSRALLATASFGQGITVTPIQMASAFGVLANGGKLLRPTIIDSIHRADGTVEKAPVRVLDQVVTPEASATITAMLVSAAEKGFAKAGRVAGYHIAAKTGTSQIAGPGGRYEAGTGSTIASFAGYGPVPSPRFVIIVKVDRPKYRETVHGAAAAAPLFKEIAAFLFKYYGIPPNEE